MSFVHCVFCHKLYTAAIYKRAGDFRPVGLLTVNISLLGYCNTLKLLGVCHFYVCTSILKALAKLVEL